MRTRLNGWVVLVLLGGVAAYCVAEEITLTTYYPSPRGVYSELRVGSGGPFPSPTGTLHVLKSADDGNVAFRVDNQDSGANPFVIDQDGKVGIGTTSPQYALDVNGHQRLRPIATPGTPTNGTMYYDTGLNQFRVYENNEWRALVVGIMWESPCFAITPGGGVYTFTHNLGGPPRVVTVYGSQNSDCSNAGVLQGPVDSNGAGATSYVVYPITSTQITFRNQQPYSTQRPYICA